MTLKQAQRLKPGAIVRRSWYPDDDYMGMVVSKKYVRKKHMAKVLGGLKKERYDYI